MNVKNNCIAHRGAFNNKDIPENSMKAFQKAIELDIAIELDVQLTKDNVLIVFHDFNLKRMTGVNKNISDTTYSELQKYSLLDTNEKIPTFREVVDLVHDQVLLDIEIKDTKRIRETCEILLQELNPYHHFILKSFNPKIVRFFKKKNPSLEVGYLIEKKYPKKIYDILLPSTLMIHYSKADFLAIHKSLLFTKKFQKLSKTYPILVWTITKEGEISNKDYILICNNLVS